MAGDLGGGSGGWHNHLGPELLARTPLFGAGAVPLLWLHDDFSAIQTFSIIATSASLIALLPAAVFRDRQTFLWGACLAIISPFVLLHTSNDWSKLLAGACVLVSLRTAAGRREQQNFIAPAAWFAMAVAAHHSSILFAPLLFAVSFEGQPLSRRDLIVRLASVACFGFVLVGAFEAWAIAKYGLHTRVSSNPTLTWRNDVPFAANTALVALSTLCGWFPIAIIQKARSGMELQTVANWSVLGFYSTAIWVASLSGTLLGNVLPLWLSSTARVRSAWRLCGKSSHPRAVVSALACAFAGNALLNPYAAAAGAVQTGLTPLSMLLVYAFLKVCAENRDAVAVRKGAAWSFALGTVPFLAASGLVTLLLNIHRPFSTSILDVLQRSDADFRAFTSQGFIALGVAGFPWLPLAIGGLVVATVYYFWRAPFGRTQSNNSAHSHVAP